jgi:hypothetical protein
MVEDRSWWALRRSEVARARGARVSEPTEKALDEAKSVLRRISERLGQLRKARTPRRDAK